MTNFERAKAGKPPFVIKNDKPVRVELHHSRQNGKGPLFEASQTTHRAKKGKGREALHPYGSEKHPNFPVDRKEFDVDRTNYWKMRAKEIKSDS